MISDLKMKYSLGALLYSPALNQKIGQSVVSGRLGGRYSLALCLEDTVPPGMVPAAEAQAAATLREISSALGQRKFFLPRIFIRVREPEQILRVFEAIKGCGHVFTGFVLPKYTVSNAAAYNEAMAKANAASARPVYMMPILESGDLVDLRFRAQRLGEIKDALGTVRDLVLNVRVGGNDFSNAFGVRRHWDETIYEIQPLAQLLGDILAMFSGEYVVAGPVWEFFSGEGGCWEKGLRRELKLDRLNGFVGKTVIHPNQIPVVNEMMRIPKKDFEDARSILGWNTDSLLVGKSCGGERMNEVRTNYNWAQKTAVLAEIYGTVE